MKNIVIDPENVIHFVTDLLDPVMHYKRAYSISLAVLGVMYSDRLSIAAVGRSLASVRGTSPKHGIKKVDRLLSNPKFDVEEGFVVTVPWLVAYSLPITPPLIFNGAPSLERARKKN